MIICSCANITLKQIEEVILNGANTIEKVMNCLPVCQNCGSCRYYIEEVILKENLY